MRIAYCLTGFARTIHSKSVIHQSIKQALPTGSHVDLFWYCPTQLDPDDTSTRVDQQELLSGFQCDPIRSVNVTWFDYTPSTFYKEFETFSFPPNDVKSSRSVFRTLSQVHNISKSVELAYQSGNRYDVVIITRNDYIPYVHSYGIPSAIRQGIYAYRTCPYRTNSQQVGLDGNFLDTEDRAFYGSHDEMMKFRYFYTQLRTVFKSPKLYPEVLHTEFIRSFVPERAIYYQDGIQIVFPPTRTDISLYKLNKAEEQVVNDRFGSH